MKKLILSAIILFLSIGFALAQSCPSVCNGSNLFLGNNAGRANNPNATGNTFVGQSSGRNNTSGAGNTFIGSRAGFANLGGQSNTFMGRSAGQSNLGGNDNVFIGRIAGSSNINGSDNIFIGNSAGFNNTSGSGNTFIGRKAGSGNSTASNNTFVGFEAGLKNDSGFGNTFLGASAGVENTTGESNAFFGAEAGFLNQTGFRNAFFGQSAGRENVNGFRNAFFGYRSGVMNTSGNSNCFFGGDAGSNNIDGNFNAFFGAFAGSSNTSGTANSFFGRQAGLQNTTGISNTFVGSLAGFANALGNNNTYLGFESGKTNIEGSGNVFIGYQAGFSELSSNKLYISNSNTETPLIYGDFEENVLATSGTLGVGVKNPEAELHVRDGGDFDKSAVLFLQPSEWNSRRDIAEIRLGDRFHYVRAANNEGMTLGDYNGIFFKTGGTRPQTRMLIDFDGNVGIGTENPSQIFHSKGAIRFEDLPIRDLTTNTGSILLVDATGDVFVGANTFTEVVQENEQLKQELKTVQNRLDELESLVRQLSQKIEEEDDDDLRPALHQNTPNPFHQSSTIQYYVPSQASSASLSIFDGQGNELKHLVIYQMGAGAINLQAHSLKPGLYTYTLVVNGQVIDTKRMLITE